MNQDLRNAYPALALMEESLLAEGAREFVDEDAALAEELLAAADVGLTGSDIQRAMTYRRRDHAWRWPNTEEGA